MSSPRASRIRPGGVLLGAFLIGVLTIGVGTAVLVVVLEIGGSSQSCGGATLGASAAGAIALGPPGSGARVGASEYGGPGDPSSGTIGARGDDLLLHPDSYAELGGLTWQTARAMGGLDYMTPLRITWGHASAVAYKRDFGLGGGPVAGLPRVIDLWWQLAGRLGIPYEDGLWSGAVHVSRPPATGAAGVLGGAADGAVAAGELATGATVLDGCGPGSGGLAVALTPGPRAVLLPGGDAAAPAAAPVAVKEMIAAGNQIAGKPYVYGGGHGLPLSEVGSSYDCSSSVDHLLYGARLLAVSDTETSGSLMSFGLPGPGRWVTLYASPDHVFMYVAGLRWDTHNAAGPADGSLGIGWHPLVRDAAGFVARHPAGL